MELSQKDFIVLETLENHEIETQRQLAHHAGISLGQVNYVLKSMFNRGLVKIGKFKKNPNKIRYVYLLTPKGIEAKSKLAATFILNQLKKYDSLRKKLANKLVDEEQEGCSRVLFVGPGLVYDLIGSVIREMNLDLTLVGNLERWQDLRNRPAGSYDRVLIFDIHIESLKNISRQTGTPTEKLSPLF